MIRDTLIEACSKLLRITSSTGSLTLRFHLSTEKAILIPHLKLGTKTACLRVNHDPEFKGKIREMMAAAVLVNTTLQMITMRVLAVVVAKMNP